MRADGLRGAAQAALSAWHASRSEEVSDEQLRADAWVIAPHPDDEVLGCGGTIARKVTLGARVRVCFLTDGSSSHEQWIEKSKLRELRKREARAACAKLGVAKDEVIFLDFEDGSLAAHVEEATTELRRCFERSPGTEVYAPHHREEPEDHRAACWIARAAVRGLTAPSVYLEYPVWCWNEWPWIEVRRDRGALRTAARAAMGFTRSLRLLHECRWRVPIGEVRNQKKQALEAHETQMFGLHGVEDCPTLSDVAGGEFLKRFFANHEIFLRYGAPPPPPSHHQDTKNVSAHQKNQWPKTST